MRVLEKEMKKTIKELKTQIGNSMITIKAEMDWDLIELKMETEWWWGGFCSVQCLHSLDFPFLVM